MAKARRTGVERNMRTLATIQMVETVEPVEMADALERIKVLGWWVVANKGQMKPGEKVVYCEIDSLLPERPEFEFLRKMCFREAIVTGGEVLQPAGFRIRTVKLRGQVSQGICFPLSILPEGTPTDLGTDVTDMLGIVKYDPPLPSCLGGVVKGFLPEFIPKTDETRVQVLERVIAQHKGREVYYTEKLDGSSATIFVYGNQQGVCGRGLWFHDDDPNNSICQIVRELKVLPKLRKLSEEERCWYALQAEVIGPGIQKNHYALSKTQLRVFNVLKINDGRQGTHLVHVDDMSRIASAVGLETIPMLGTFILDHTVDQLVEMSKGKSQLNPKIHREGIVIRPLAEVNDPTMGRLSFKAINPDFLLKYDT